MNVTFLPRDRLGQYELLVELASGGMATVGIALQHGAAGFERLVVVKRVHRNFLQNTDFMNMFRDEARLASSIRHPNVVPVIDVVEMTGELLLVMEFVESVSLGTLMRAARDAKERLPAAVVAAIVGDALAGLHGAHEATDIRRNKLDIVHRDVSPQNLIVGVDGVTRVIDFGIAKAAHRLTETRDGFIKGKFSYMSPEQVEADPLDRRSDVFSAGIVLFEALTGTKLFRGDSEFEILQRVMTGDIPPPSTLAPELPSAVDDLVGHALARDPDERFQSALAFHNALESTLRPARPREVAELVGRMCREPIAALRSRLQEILGDQLEKLSPRGASGARVASAVTAPAAGTIPSSALPSTVREPSHHALSPTSDGFAAATSPSAARSARGAASRQATLRSSEAPAHVLEGAPASMAESSPGSSAHPIPGLAPTSRRGPLAVAAGMIALGGLVAAVASTRAGPSAPEPGPADSSSTAPPIEAAAGDAPAPLSLEPITAPSGTSSAPRPLHTPRPRPRDLAPNPYGHAPR